MPTGSMTSTFNNRRLSFSGIDLNSVFVQHISHPCSFGLSITTICLVPQQFRSRELAVPMAVPNEQNNQPPEIEAGAHHEALSHGWTSDFWDCCSPCGTCCLSCWCPCILFGRIQAREEGEINPSGCNWMVSLACRCQDPSD
jgi:hypothetical protein